jgi:arylsulfatase A-like enzyme
MLSGRNHHTVGMGAITEIATSAPGNSTVRPKDCAPLAETLRLNGYSTAQFGKCHEVPVWQTSPVEPDRRPEEGYHLTEDLTDRSVAWAKQQKALMPDKPLFMYYAPGATHAPVVPSSLPGWPLRWMECLPHA